MRSALSPNHPPTKPGPFPWVWVFCFSFLTYLDCAHCLVLDQSCDKQNVADFAVGQVGVSADT